MVIAAKEKFYTFQMVSEFQFEKYEHLQPRCASTKLITLNEFNYYK